MSLQVLDIITARAPALAANPSLGVYIGIAQTRVAPASVTGWTADKYSLAVAYRTMHDMTLDLGVNGTGGARPFGEAGALQEKKEGQQSAKFGNSGRSVKAAPLDPDLSQTYWGMQLIGLGMGTFAAVTVAGGPATQADWCANPWEFDE